MKAGEDNVVGCMIVLNKNYLKFLRVYFLPSNFIFALGVGGQTAGWARKFR